MINWSKLHQIIILLVIVSALLLSGFYFYDFQKTKSNTQKAEKVLDKYGFSSFYQRENNKFCTHTKDKEKQKEIIDDIIWTLKNIEKVEVREIKEIQCEDGSKGVLIK